jgi:hypothetical protein
MERFNLKKLNEVQGKEKYRVEVPNRFAALEDLDAEVDINSAWKTEKNAIFWDMTPRGACKKRRFRATYHLHHQSEQNQ